jgi:hypothetical protein
MIVWTGLGFVVPGISVFCFYVTQLVMTSIFKDARYYTEHGWPKFLACLLASGLVYLLGLSLSSGKVHIDQRTGKQVIIRRSHSFFFIPVLFWAPIIAICGLALLFL